MKGIQHIEVSNRKAKFRFDLNRNITIVCGDSGTGKTTLYSMIADHTRFQESSGVQISSTKPCVALMDMDWENQLSKTADSIVFVDEGAQYVSSKAFASAVKHSDNYYVIFNREALYELPYSVEEIYEIKTSGKYHLFKKRYPARALHRYTKEQGAFQTLLTEDSQSGYQFFEEVFRDTGVQCVSATSNALIFKWMNEHPKEKALIIADGAAFGAQMDRVMKLCRTHPGQYQLCLPESFEWMILKSGLIRAEHLEHMLEHTSEYVESGVYFSWENFFTHYLMQHTVDTPFQYQKSRLNKAYAQKNNRRRIVAEILPDMDER